MSAFAKTSLVVALMTVAFSDAHAYIDPGTGSAIIQGLIASVALIGVTLRTYWFRIRAFFAPASKQKDSGSPENAVQDDTLKG